MPVRDPSLEPLEPLECEEPAPDFWSAEAELSEPMPWFDCPGFFCAGGTPPSYGRFCSFVAMTCLLRFMLRWPASAPPEPELPAELSKAHSTQVKTGCDERSDARGGKLSTRLRNDG